MSFIVQLLCQIVRSGYWPGSFTIKGLTSNEVCIVSGVSKSGFPILGFPGKNTNIKLLVRLPYSANFDTPEIQVDTVEKTQGPFGLQNGVMS